MFLLQMAIVRYNSHMKCILAMLTVQSVYHDNIMIMCHCNCNVIRVNRYNMIRQRVN